MKAHINVTIEGSVILVIALLTNYIIEDQS